MCGYMHVHMCMYAHMCACTCMHTYTSHVHSNMQVFTMHTSNTCACLHACAYVDVCVWIYMCVCIHACTHVCMCMHTHTHHVCIQTYMYSPCTHLLTHAHVPCMQLTRMNSSPYTHIHDTIHILEHSTMTTTPQHGHTHEPRHTTRRGESTVRHGQGWSRHSACRRAKPPTERIGRCWEAENSHEPRAQPFDHASQTRAHT